MGNIVVQEHITCFLRFCFLRWTSSFVEVVEFIENVSVAIRRLPNRIDAATSWDRLQNLARLFDLFFVDSSQAFIRNDRLLKMKTNLGTTARTLRAVLSIFEKMDDAFAALFSCNPYVTEINYLELKDLIEKRDSLIDYLFETHTNGKDLLSSESLWYVHRLHKLLIRIKNGDLVSQLSSKPGKLWKLFRVRFRRCGRVLVCSFAPV